MKETTSLTLWRRDEHLLSYSENQTSITLLHKKKKSSSSILLSSRKIMNNRWLPDKSNPSKTKLMDSKKVLSQRKAAK